MAEDEKPVQTPTPTPAPEPKLTDEEILKRADAINTARRQEQDQKIREAEAEKAARAAEAERIKREAEKEEAARIAEANRIKAAEAAKKEEELRQARRLVDEDNRKKAAAEPKKKKHIAGKIIFVIIILLIIIFGLGIASLSIENNPTSNPGTLPYQTSYKVWMNQGTTNIAGMQISLMSDATVMLVTMPYAPTTRINQGEQVTVGPNNIRVTLFWGALKILDMNYKATCTYRGISDANLVTFDVLINSSEQMPEWLLNIALSIAGIKYDKANIQ